MRYYSIAYPTDGGDVVETLSEEDIRAQYYTYWVGKMIQNVPNADLSWEHCLEDWITVHWAQEACEYDYDKNLAVMYNYTCPSCKHRLENACTQLKT